MHNYKAQDGPLDVAHLCDVRRVHKQPIRQKPVAHLVPQRKATTTSADGPGALVRNVSYEEHER